jgi:hypothetical protein
MATKLYTSPIYSIWVPALECQEGQEVCRDNDLYRCINGKWTLVEKNSSRCITVPPPVPECKDGDEKCIGDDLYRCVNGSWVLVEKDSMSCLFGGIDARVLALGAGVAILGGLAGLITMMFVRSRRIGLTGWPLERFEEAERILREAQERERRGG